MWRKLSTWKYFPKRSDELSDEILHAIFLRSAARHPQRIALRLADPGPESLRKVELTYGQLRERAEHFARYLQSKGVQRGDRVVICLPRGMDQYMVLLGSLMAGATYVPLDWSVPHERANYVARDCGAAAIVTEQARGVDFVSACPTIIAIDADLGDIAAPGKATTLPRLDGDDLAYIIYTSGSTGHPKGVMIRHRNIAFQVRSESEILRLTRDDIVYAGASLAFDVSVEEMWAAFYAGATLLVGSERLAKSVDEMPGVLHEYGVTVWCPVPSLLLTVNHPLPTVRLINLGGEVCPPELVRTWAGSTRRIINSYGPTETSVTATWCELTGHEPVTIGKPLRGFRCWIVDETLKPVPPGKDGELLIGGDGVGAGYLNRPELTEQKFVAWPGAQGQTVYRTGDLVRQTGNGDIAFLGRIDLQVKIRGHRVELGEIEAVIGHVPGVGQAVVRLFDEGQPSQLLAAFVAANTEGAVNIGLVRTIVEENLPDYMRPAAYVVMERLPTLVSGKVDRSALARPDTIIPAKCSVAVPENDRESRLLEIWKKLFAPFPVSTMDNFFEDLGGHSLLAARMVSEARNDPDMCTVAIRDLYAAPTIRQLAQRLALRAGRKRNTFLPVQRSRYFLCAVAQAFAACLVYAFSGAQWVLPYLVYTTISTSAAASRGHALAAAAAVFVVLPPVMMIVSILLKWAVIGRFKAGEYPLWGAYYFRWWFVRRILNAVPTQFLAGTPLMAVYFRLLGAKIGANAYLQTGSIDAPDLVSIGHDAIVGQAAQLSTSCVEGGMLKLGYCRIGQGASIGTMSVVGQNACIGDGATLDDMSALAQNGNIPAGQNWGGSPAMFRAPAPVHPKVAPPSRLRRVLIVFALLFGAGILPLMAVLPVAPGLIGMMELDWASENYNYLALSPCLALAYIAAMCLFTVAMKWLLLGRVKPGSHSIWSWFYVRFWFVQKLNELSLDLLHPLFATLYVKPWCRAMGASVGARAEISTAASVAHDLVEIGEESFIADGVEFGAGRARPGYLTLARTRVGRRTFLGNSALVPSGYDVADEVLIGVLSRPPERSDGVVEKGSTWFGSPPLRLPTRQTAVQFSEGARFRPSSRLVAARLAIELIRILLPLTLFIVMFCLMLTIAGDLSELPNGRRWVFGMFPLLYLGFVAGIGAGIVALKWLVVSRYRPMVAPLWSMFVWRNELVTSAYENLAVPLLLEPLRGTPFINVFLRLMGCRIGRRVFTDTTDITEFDMIDVGDDASLNDGAALQTHLFEDRVMKVGPIRLGRRTTVGSQSIVLYDARMEEGSSLGDLSVLMKGEVLPAGTAWEGAPARSIDGI